MLISPHPISDKYKYLETLDTKSLVLDISVNLSRIGRFIMTKNLTRANQFSQEVSHQLSILSTRTFPDALNFSIIQTKKLNDQLTSGKVINSSETADDFFTYSLILQHKSKSL